LNYETTKNKFAEMGVLMKGLLAAVVKNPNGELTPNWEKAYAAVIDSYIGETPQNFIYKSKTYTQQSFAKEVVGVNPEEYIEMSSFANAPYYTKTMLIVPDNWSFDQVYNVKLNDMTDIIDYALKNGFTVAWDSDVSEKSFSWKNGIAYIPEKKVDDMTNKEKENMFNGPKNRVRNYSGITPKSI
jgi:bleomycin hydrolase